MLWVLKRTVSMRRFFWAPKTHVSMNRQEKNEDFTQIKFAYLDLCGSRRKILSEGSWQCFCFSVVNIFHSTNCTNLPQEANWTPLGPIASRGGVCTSISKTYSHALVIFQGRGGCPDPLSPPPLDTPMLFLCVYMKSRLGQHCTHRHPCWLVDKPQIVLETKSCIFNQDLPIFSMWLWMGYLQTLTIKQWCP